MVKVENPDPEKISKDLIVSRFNDPKKKFTHKVGARKQDNKSERHKENKINLLP